MKEYCYAKHEGQIIRIEFNTIRFIEGDRVYSRMFIDGGRHVLVRRTIKELESLLPGGRFIRIHKSYLVPLARISWVSRYEVMLDCRTTLPIGGVFSTTMNTLVLENML
ncbi:MAG TPA: LytTR family DNA-binding domain-containing protein [Chitinophagaceae bacterium]|jgi:DNA-binding LytR/AlgR family response regulator|nr:LytTR family DNA-binding domain-containing protein [Chitinophagaceae bacterium]